MSGRDKKTEGERKADAERKAAARRKAAKHAKPAAQRVKDIQLEWREADRARRLARNSARIAYAQHRDEEDAARERKRQVETFPAQSQTPAAFFGMIEPSTPDD